MSFQPTSTASAIDQDGPLRPAGWWYAVAIAVLLVGAVLSIRGGFAAVDHVRDGFHQLKPGTARTLQLGKDRRQTVYAVWLGGKGGVGLDTGTPSADIPIAPKATVTVTGPNGEAVDFREDERSNSTITYDGKHGVKVGTFLPDRSGAYEVLVDFADAPATSEGEPAYAGISSFQLGRDIRNILLPAAIGFFVGLGLILNTSIRRGVEKGRRRRAAFGQGAPDVGWNSDAAQRGSGPPPMPGSGSGGPIDFG